MKLATDGPNAVDRTNVEQRFQPISGEIEAEIATQLVGNVGEGRVGSAADRGDRAQANYNDQSQHHSVFNCGWAVF